MSGFQPITPDIMKVKEFDKDILTQYSCDEIQLVRQQAQSATPNEISFNMKLPDPSALVHSTIWMRVRARFKMTTHLSSAGGRSTFQSYDERIRGAKVSDHIMWPAGICPIQAKLFSNVSCTVNNVSFMCRADEILEPVLRMCVPGKVCSKISGVPYQEFYTKKVGNDLYQTFSQPDGGEASKLYVPGDYEWKASEKWRKECLKVGKKATYTGVY